MDKPLKHRINAAREAVKAQVGFFRAQWGRVQSEWKEDDTRVTFADFAISENVIAALRADFPKDDYCSEESSPEDETLELEAKYAWVLDPIDGTNNYAAGLPVCSISLALLKDGWPVYGVIYDHSRDKLMHGGPGHGLWDGSQKAGVKTASMGSRSVIGAHFPMDSSELSAMSELLGYCRVRAMGSSALNYAYAAAGFFDGATDGVAKVWDIAAGCALVEAGGGEFHFRSESPFPLRRFHVRGGALSCHGGSVSFCERMSRLRFE